MPLRGFGADLLDLPQKAIDATRKCIADDYERIIYPLVPVDTGALLASFTRQEGNQLTCVYSDSPYAAAVDDRVGFTDRAITYLSVRYNLRR